MRIIAGLGNPGRAYVETRHNAGWMAVDKAAVRRGVRRKDEDWRKDGVLARCGQVWFFKPLTHMNASGPAVAGLLAEAGAGPADLLVLVDDLNLELGTVRVRPRGSSGGHKGLISLIESLGTEEFPRLRMGIGPCPQDMGGRDFVLSPFDDEELDAAEAMTDLAADAALCWADEGIDAAMNRFNKKVETRQGAEPGAPPTGSSSP